MIVYLVIHQDRHFDLDVDAYATSEAAVAQAKRLVDEYRPDDLTAEQAAELKGYWPDPLPVQFLFAECYSFEGDQVTVMARELKP